MPLISSALLIRFLSRYPAVPRLLLEAVPRLDAVFGAEECWYAVDIVGEGEEELLRVAVLVPPDFSGDPYAALQTFDGEWWLEACAQADGRLVFDYERGT